MTAAVCEFHLVFFVASGARRARASQARTDSGVPGSLDSLAAIDDGVADCLDPRRRPSTPPCHVDDRIALSSLHHGGPGVPGQHGQVRGGCACSHRWRVNGRLFTCICLLLVTGQAREAPRRYVTCARPCPVSNRACRPCVGASQIRPASTFKKTPLDPSLTTRPLTTTNSLTSRTSKSSRDTAKPLQLPC